MNGLTRIYWREADIQCIRTSRQRLLLKVTGFRLVSTAERVGARHHGVDGCWSSSVQRPTIDSGSSESRRIWKVQVEVDTIHTGGEGSSSSGPRYCKMARASDPGSIGGFLVRPPISTYYRTQPRSTSYISNPKMPQYSTALLVIENLS